MSTLKIHKLKCNSRNPRILKNEAFHRLVKSIRELPEMMAMKPIIVNEDMIILAGNMRHKACKELGWKDIPAQIYTKEMHQDSESFKAYNKTYEEACDEITIKDNTHAGEWDFDILANDWDVHPLVDWGLDVWEMDEEPSEGLTDEDDVPEAPEEPITKLGDVWILGEHRVMCGDSTSKEAVEILMDGEKADMVFTDPPYALFGNSTGVAGIVDDNMVRPFFKNIMKMLKANSKQFAHIYMCCDWHSAFSIESCAREVELKAKNLCIWDKGDGGVGAMYQQCYEMIWFFDNSPTSKKTMGSTKSGVRVVNGKPNIWRFPRVTGDRMHNAQKPTEMIEVPVSNGSDVGEIVLDLFGGSGSTLIASDKIGRKAYLMEPAPSYCDVIVKRWEDYTGNKAKLEKI